MALVDVTATGDDNILNTEQIEELITDDLKYRNQQLKKLRDEVLDLEEMGENISLTDFSLDDFRMELLNFLENNRQRLTDAPYVKRNYVIYFLTIMDGNFISLKIVFMV